MLCWIPVLGVFAEMIHAEAYKENYLSDDAPEHNVRFWVSKIYQEAACLALLLKLISLSTRW
jgi:hypothetical protein